MAAPFVGFANLFEKHVAIRYIQCEKEGTVSDNYRGKRVTIMGLGVFGGGIAAARFFAERGAVVTVTDLKGEDKLAASVEALSDCTIRYRLRRHRVADFVNADIVVPSPAVPRDHRLLRLAAGHGAELQTEMNLFVGRCPARIVGITGTNGKTTTSAMVGHILGASGWRTWLGGNIGRSLLADVPEISPEDCVVLELSSFQLEWFPQTGVSPHVSVVTNIAQDHLDRHKTMQAYMAAKWPILANQCRDDWAILNAGCELLDAWRAEAPGRVFPFSSKQELSEGAFCREGSIIVAMDGRETAFAPIEALGLPGEHNLENALAGVAVCAVLGLAPAEVERGLRSFKGVEHRLELVAQIDGVRYFNDSKATTPDATIVALKSFDCPIVLIAGGSGKGLSFNEMAAEFARRARGLVVVGATGEEIASCVRTASNGGVEAVACSSLEEAVLAAKGIAQPGDVVLLSPGDASYDMFNNYEERGDMFKHLVRSLGSDQLAEQSQRS